MSMLMRYKKIKEGATTPTRGHEDDAGWDLYTLGRVVIPPRSYKEIPTGIAVDFPICVWGRITGRSSTSRNLGLMVIEGIIDTGYKGELYIRAYNPGIVEVIVDDGWRVAQMIPHLRIDLEWEETHNLQDSGRGNHGFGSTGR